MGRDFHAGRRQVVGRKRILAGAALGRTNDTAEESRSMTVGVLLCGSFSEPLQAEFGSYASMIGTLLGSRSTEVFDVRERQLPKSVSACEAYVITGSSAGVYDDLPWIKDLMAFLRKARGSAKLIGICFGHQAMAQAFGGSAIKSPNGWGIGLHRYDLPARPSWMDDSAAVAARISSGSGRLRAVRRACDRQQRVHALRRTGLRGRHLVPIPPGIHARLCSGAD
jgi:hypothetical protein